MCIFGMEYNSVSHGYRLITFMKMHEFIKTMFEQCCLIDLWFLNFQQLGHFTCYNTSRSYCPTEFDISQEC